MAETILYYTDSQIFGGAEQALLRLMKALDRTQWAPVLAYHPGEGLDSFLLAARQSDVRLLAVPEMPLGIDGAQRLASFMHIIQREQPSVFHAHLSWPLACKWGLAAAVLGRIPAVVATEQLYVEAPYTYAARLQQRLIATGVGCYISVSKYIGRKLTSVFRIPAGKIRVIPNSVPEAMFPSSCARGLPEALSHFRGRPIIMTVARLHKQKGLGYLLRAATLVPEAAFVLAGDGPEKTDLQMQASSLGLSDRVVFAGYLTDIPNWLAGCDLFVLPSFYEGLPLSLLEAMAAGKPVVATDIPGNNEVIKQGKTGWLVPPGDAEALAKGIRTILANPKMASRLAQAGQDLVRREFTEDCIVHQVTQVYEELLA